MSKARHNQSLQLTLDPAGSLPGGRAPSASSAAEHRRYAALVRWFSSALLAISLPVISACAAACPGSGPLRNFETVDLANPTLPLPDQFNVTGYVLGTILCPEDAECIQASQVIVGRSPETPIAEGLGVQTDCPERFIEGQRYTLSVGKGRILVGHK